METARRVVIDLVVFAFAILAFIIVVKFFFYPEIKTPEKTYQHQFDSIGAIIQLANQKIAYLDSTITEIDKNHDKRDKQLINNQNKENAEEKKFRAKPISGIMSFADSVYESEQKR